MATRAGERPAGDRGDAGVGDAPDLHAIFPGASEMAARCRAFDWGSTPLGPVAAWSHSLRTTVGIVLTSRQPMFLFWGPDLVQLYNDAYRPSLGAGGRADHALGACGRAFWTDIWDAIGPQIAQVMTTGVATWHEDQYLPIERNARLEDVWWTYSYSPVRDDDGHIAATLVVCQETTGRVNAERELRAANAALAAERVQLSAIVDLAPAFMAVLRGPEHRFERTNAEYDRLVGRRVRPGLTVAEALPEVVEQGFIELLDAVLATGEPRDGRAMPVRLIRTPGGAPEQRYVDFVYQALTAADGTRSGVFVHGVDVTDAVEARQAIERLLGESRAAHANAEHAAARTAQLQSLTAALAHAHTMDDVGAVVVRDMVATLGARTGALAVRASADRSGDADGDALLLARQEGFPDSVLDAVRVQPLPRRSPLTECFRTRTPVWIERRDGPEGLDARYPVAAPVWDAIGVESAAFVPLLVAGDAVGAISFSFVGPRTFTASERALLLALAQQTAVALERARLFAAEHAARESAELANRAKSDFLAVMSHELRTPLNAIGGYAELMALGVRGPVTPEQLADLTRIQRAQRHLLGLINGVLNYAKVDAGAVHYDLGDVPVDEVLATCEALVAPQVRAKQLTLQYDGGDDPALTVRADREKLQQIVLNLLSNAVKFTEPGGRVTLAAAADAERVRITVADTGVGIAPEQIERVFQPFVQVDARLTRTQEGTGLGLAISRDLARGMGGDLAAESAPGVGSTFTLALPRA